MNASDHYMPQLDGLRAFAALTVVAEHAWLYHFVRFGRNGVGVWGVWLFFVLSGFLITGVLLRARDGAPSLGAALARFYARRALRIFPLYYAVLLLGAALGIGSALREYLPWHLLYATNWRIAITGHWLDTPAGPLWSLAIEEQFYLVWPFLVLRARRDRLRALFVGTACLGIASRGALAALGFHHHAAPSVLQPTTSNLDPLAWGALLAWSRWTSPADGEARARWTARALVAGLGALTLTVGCSILGRGHRLLLVVEPLGAGLLAVWAIARAADGFAPASPAARVLLFRPVRYLGTISYGIYLLHSPVIWMTRAWLHWGQQAHPSLSAGVAYGVVVTAITVALASLSWWGLERPLNRLKGRVPAHRAGTPAVVAPARAVTGCACA